MLREYIYLADICGAHVNPSTICIQLVVLFSIARLHSLYDNYIICLCVSEQWKIFTSLLLSTGLTNIITVDLHSKEIQGFYDAPVDNLRASPFLVQYITEKVLIVAALRIK